MRTRQVGRCLSIAAITVWTTLITAAGIPVAAAAPCPDVEVIFARGTGERAGLGSVGKAFVNSLRSKVRGTMSVYAVNYPASLNFSPSTNAGAKDANAHVQYMAATCPATKMVLGGMSQGAGVIDLITIGAKTIWFFTPVPLPSPVADHVAAVAVFGNPSRDYWFLGPLTTMSPQYGAKTIDLCARGDPYCSSGDNFFAHFMYPYNGMVNQAATFAASRL